MKRITLLTSLLVLNTSPLFAVSEIQGFHLGDSVRASCNSEAILLIKGTISSITETNVTINTRQTNFTIARDQVTLRPVVKFTDSVLTNRPQMMSEAVAQELGTNEFQGFKVGERIRAICAGRAFSVVATITAIGQSEITIRTQMDTYTLPKDQLTLLPIAKFSPASTVAQHASVKASGTMAVQQDAGQSLLNKFSGAPGYNDANAYYKQTMAGVNSGQISVNDILGQALKTLADVDKFAPERGQNPEFEPYIAQLRDFVARAQAGEQIEGVALP
jgi:hypothetical protein